MFFNEGRAVQIVGTLKCLTDSMCLTTPRFITSSRRKMRKTPARRSKRPKTLTEVLNHDINDLHDLLFLVVLVIHIVVSHQHKRPVTHIENIQNFHVNQHNPSILNPKIPTEHPNVPGLLLLVVLAAHSAVDQQTT